ncbi:hypothetical protein ABTY98_02825 [Streptomyces sp. NPDC096040]|uniref:hypothetical protein n=1 Tax=Streptomyces sp. NPDC096040 TaxID=3155541 RepID=UPI00331A0768
MPAVHTARPAPAVVVTSTGGDGEDHERFMRAAVDQARRNPRYPFGAVLVGSGRVLGRGANTSAENRRTTGRRSPWRTVCAGSATTGGRATSLYATGEPCAMCMSACTLRLGRGGPGRLGHLDRGARPHRTGPDRHPGAGSGRRGQVLLLPRLHAGVPAGTTDALFRRAQILRGNRAGGAP